MTNCVITTDNINRAEAIDGPSVPCLEGHMIRRKPQEYDKIEKITLSSVIKQHYLKVSLAMDFSL